MCFRDKNTASYGTDDVNYRPVENGGAYEKTPDTNMTYKEYHKVGKVHSIRHK